MSMDFMKRFEKLHHLNEQTAQSNASFFSSIYLAKEFSNN